MPSNHDYQPYIIGSDYNQANQVSTLCLLWKCVKEDTHTQQPRNQLNHHHYTAILQYLFKIGEQWGGLVVTRMRSEIRQNISALVWEKFVYQKYFDGKTLLNLRMPQVLRSWLSWNSYKKLPSPNSKHFGIKLGKTSHKAKVYWVCVAWQVGCREILDKSLYGSLGIT
ncbi:hypothetical protein MKW98_027665 [Papaver atlanticum]|uniref:Uncharacterized protein n=1 Tax=Papaver atlanticum TaxID=357466 RepID=A0AAD4SVF5_9MAGN|nr:hypothetical protein MKW98_027665 [Papaver atlanticum]